MMEPVIATTLGVVLVTAVGIDLWSSRIPNWLTFTAMSVAVTTHAWMSGTEGVIFSLMGLGSGLGLFVLLYAMGSMGAGDVKLMAAVGALTGPYGALSSAVLALVVGGVYALGAMCFQWGAAPTGRKLIAAFQGAWMTGGKSWSRDLALPFRLRYGVAIACGTLLFQLGLHPFGG